MAACTNNGGSRARRAVTAALVGVLSVGTVPMVALATGAEDGIETMAVDWATNATVTKAQDGMGNTISGDPMKQTFALGSGKYLVPLEVTNSMGDVTDVTEDGYSLSYAIPNGSAAANADGSYDGVVSGYNYTYAGCPNGYFYFSGTMNAEQAAAYFAGELKGYSAGAPKINPIAGNYNAVVTDNEGNSQGFMFKVADQAVAQGVQVKGALVYDGTNQKAGIEFVDADGNTITPALNTPGDSTSGYRWTFYDGRGNQEGDADYYGGTNGVVNAGDYVVKFIATDGNSYTVPFTVGKLDLSSASVFYDDTVMNSVVADTAFVNGLEVNGKTISPSLAGVLNVTKVSSPDNTGVLGASKGEYEVTVSALANNSNVSGSATVKFCNLTTDDVTAATDVRYGSKAVSAAMPNLEFSLVDGESFDASKLSVKGAVTGDSYKGDQLEISYFDLDNKKAVDASALSKKGNYEVTIRVKPFQDWTSGAWVGGSETIVVKITPAQLDADENLGFYFDGEIAGTDESVTYDGSDWLEKISVVVKDANGNTMTEGADYELSVTKDGKDVDAAVDAGTYVVKVKALTFDLATSSVGDDTFTLTVKPVELTRLVADVDSMELEADKTTGKIPADNGKTPGATDYVANEFYVKYTGSAVEVPAVKYEVSNAAGTSYSYVTLDPSLYNVVSIKDKNDKVVKEAVEAGAYTVKIALTDEAAGNYTLLTSDSEFTFTIREYGHFVDVNPSAWYAQAVEQAYNQYYVNGIGGTNVFMPGADITRADAVGIIYNMAGGHADDDFSFDEMGGYITGFSDVDGHAYYAKAIAWAKAAGVVNGHDGAFNPDAKITRQEFAAMLANYAKATDNYVAPSADALDGIADAASVDAWATESVSWAVENGVMGNAGSVWAGNTITRAEVAAMAVNYQPENLEGYHRVDNPRLLF